MAAATWRACDGGQLGHLAQALRPDGGQVRGGGQGAERLVGADVAGRLLAADVLLARLQGEDVALAALRVAGRAHQPAGHLPHRCHARRHEPDVRPAVRKRDAQRLALGRHDVGAVVAGRRQHGQRGRLDHRDQLRADGMRRLAQLAHRLESRRRSWAAGRPGRPRRRPAPVRPPRPGSGRCRPRPGRPAPPRSRCPAPSNRWPARRAPAAPRRSRSATRSRRVRRQAISAASAVAVAPS